MKRVRLSDPPTNPNPDKPKAAITAPKAQPRGRPFEKGNPGKQKGMVNKALFDIRNLLNQAAHEIGSDTRGKEGALGYLKMLAIEYPPVFAGMWAKTIPQVVNATVDSTQTVTVQTVAELQAEMRLKGIPVVPSLFDDSPLIEGEAIDPIPEGTTFN